MYRAIVVLGVILSWLVPAGSSHAGLMFQFAVGGTPQTAINIGGPDATLPIQVYLSQTGTTTILTDEGLAIAGIQVTFDNLGGIAAVPTVGDIQQNPAFDDTTIPTPKVVTATTAGLEEATDPFIPSPFVFPDGNGRIWLGTFTFTGLALGTTTIGVTDLSAGDDIFTGLGNPLDGLIDPGSATLTVTPEPNSVALWLVMVGAASVVASYRARRRRKLQAADDGDPAAASSL